MMIYVYMINVGVLVMIVECNARRSPIDQADTLCSDMANQPAIQPAKQKMQDAESNDPYTEIHRSGLRGGCQPWSLTMMYNNSIIISPARATLLH